jgi:DUF4097 and DUF4098 domain-containing protein YvlB
MKRQLLIGLLLTMVLVTISAGGKAEREIYPLQDGTSITISSDVPQVIIRKGTRVNHMIIELDAMQKDYRLSVHESRKKIVIEVEKRKRLALTSLTIKQPRLIITLPEDHQLDEFAIASVSGAIESDIDIIADHISIDSVSGAITFANLYGETSVELNTVSGAVSGNTISAENISIDTISGKIDLNIIDASKGTFQVVSVSGPCSTKQLSAKAARLQSISGSLTIALASSFSGTIEAATLSGATHIELPYAQVIKTQGESQQLQIGSGKQQLSLATTSGTIRITQ